MPKTNAPGSQLRRRPPLSLVPRTVSMDPDEMGPDFDPFSRQLPPGNETLNLYDVPRYVRISLRRIMAWHNRGRTERAKIGPIASACVEHGCQWLETHPVIGGFLGLVDEAETQKLPPDATVEVEIWRSVRFTLSDPHHSGTCRVSFRCPERIRAEVFSLGDYLGLSGSTTAALCLLVGLHEQENVNPAHSRTMIRDVESFLDIVERRAERLKALMSTVEKGVWGDKDSG